MRHRSIGIAALLLAAGTGLAIAQPKEKPVKMGLRTPEKTKTEKRALAVIEAPSGGKLSGTALFVQEGTGVMLEITLKNAPPGTHAVHIHEKGECTGPDFMTAGAHWNPTQEAHGQWGRAPFHRGDIGNIVVAEDGTGMLAMNTDAWSIGGDVAKSVLDRAIIVHANVDDFVTQPTGNAGGRIACGIIREQR